MGRWRGDAGGAINGSASDLAMSDRNGAARCVEARVGDFIPITGPEPIVAPAVTVEGADYRNGRRGRWGARGGARLLRRSNERSGKPESPNERETSELIQQR